MEASTVAPENPAAQDADVAADTIQAPVVAEPEPQHETTPGTVHLADGKAVEITSIESFLEQMAGDAGEIWVKVEQVGGKAIAFLKSVVVAHE